ncbi:hypothetical protein [Paenibacillus vini]|uniref:Uncharacterized protein n=1 Tax=Paenibacillus vini TaxID=1476024 RepID=A0ABQ4MGT4_9BACL|nr:hypothetical protein [Paenibacillus vini]GIP55205.1 hypothetical protein J42TS3_42400 [Paenibacillus vini]
MDKTVQQAFIEMCEQMKTENEKIQTGIDIYFGGTEQEDQFFGRVTN